MPEPQDRTRTYSWSDPAVFPAKAAGRSGIEVLRALAGGELPAPPILQLIGFESFEAEEGRVALTMRAAEFHYNPLGTVHGGIIATLLDTATGCAVYSVLPAGLSYTSVDLTTKFLRPVTLASGLLTSVGTVISHGRRTALAEARLTDEAGRLVAQALSTCLIFEAA
jgi:uncharacterized protein (TIGR00369 family)